MKTSKKFKNSKATGSEELTMQFFIYAYTHPKIRFLTISNICRTTHQIPGDWEKAIIPVF
jgi:hypothetical protein